MITQQIVSNPPVVTNQNRSVIMYRAHGQNPNPGESDSLGFDGVMGDLEAAQQQAKDIAAANPTWFVSVQRCHVEGRTLLGYLDAEVIQMGDDPEDYDPWGNDFNNDDLLNMDCDY